MKTSHLFLSLVSLSLTVISARAATAENSNSDCIELPAFTVEAPRHTDAERQIARNLDELRAAARRPLEVTTEVALQPAPAESGKAAARPAPVMIVAKS